LMRNKQKGRDTGGDLEKAIKTEALVNAGVIDEGAATDFEKLEASLDFVAIAIQAEETGLDFDVRAQLKGKNVEDLSALNSLATSITEQAEIFKSQGVDVTALNDKFNSDSTLTADEMRNEAIESKELLRQLQTGEVTVDDARKNVDNQNAASGSPEMRALLDELNKLNLSEDELAEVLKDLSVGPQASVPGSPPSSITSLTLMEEVKMLTLIEDITIDGKINSTMFMASEEALASVFFQDLAGAYGALSALDQSSLALDSGQADSTNDEMVLGGRKISINTGTYDLGNSASSFDYLIAATDTLSLLGDVVFNSSSDATLILLSAQSIDLTEADSISFSGEELGLGSFDSLNVENVDLKAEGTISLRSLDSIVLKNSAMETTRMGADFIHLLAANQITADSVQFSAMVKQITMEAMTINLSNINFPSGSNVNLNSLYGGINGKYPSFGSTTQYGRVNFIKGMSYGSNSVMNRTNFDLYGGNIKIGNSGN